LNNQKTRPDKADQILAKIYVLKNAGVKLDFTPWKKCAEKTALCSFKK